LGVGIIGIIILVVGGVLFFVDRKQKKVMAAN
jgi:glucose uptake protein GlcU